MNHEKHERHEKILFKGGLFVTVLTVKQVNRKKRRRRK